VSPRDLAILPILPSSIATGSRSDTVPSPSSDPAGVRTMARACL